MTGQHTIKERENERSRGRKRYLERLAETREKNKEIEDYVPENNDVPLNEENKKLD